MAVGLNRTVPAVMVAVPPTAPETAVTVSGSPLASVSLAAGLPAPETGRSKVVSSEVVLVSSTATGATFSPTSVTVIVRLFAYVAPSRSLARTRIDNVGSASKSNEAAVSSRLPSMVNEPLFAAPAPETSTNLCLSPGSGSVAVNVPTSVPAGEFSATAAGCTLMLVGGSFWLTTSHPDTTSSPMSANARSPDPGPHLTMSPNADVSRLSIWSLPLPPRR